MALQVKTNSERLMFSTVRLEVGNQIGTGFFYRLDTERKSIIVISNRHLAENVSSLENLDYSKTTIEQQTSFEIRTVSIPKIPISQKITWYLHPTVDLAFFDLTSILPDISNKGICWLEHKFIPSQQMLENLTAIENVLMVGYPQGLYDVSNNFPIFRTGITASHPAIDFNGEKKGMLDMACLQGSSGSPVLIVNEGSYVDKTNGQIIKSDRVIFLGIENSSPSTKTPAYVLANNNLYPVQGLYTEQYLNLGWYIKSSEILGFDTIIKNLGL